MEGLVEFCEVDLGVFGGGFEVGFGELDVFGVFEEILVEGFVVYDVF